MSVDNREDQYREPQNVPIPEPAENNTPELEPDAQAAQTDTIDTNPDDQGSNPVPDSNS